MKPSQVEKSHGLILEADVLVIGSGLAGATAALRAAELGAEVMVVSRDEAASRWAQGGIVSQGISDSPDLLREDILAAGCGLNRRCVVDLVAREGPALVQTWLIEQLGVPFDRDAQGSLDFTLEAAHRTARILHVRDHTGAAISASMDEALRKEPRVRVHAAMLVDLLLSHRHDARLESEYEPARVRGAYVLDQASGQVVAIQAKAVVLATGGFSSLYQHSTGPKTSRGCGIAAAHRAGARTLHLEFVQFHPTALFIPNEPRRLLTEALRGAGAQLLSGNKTRFIDELLPRDVVARAIHQEMVASRIEHVWMDLRSVVDLELRFPSVVSLLKDKGFDPREDLIPVVPAAHYTMGGVWTDEQGATSVPGLYAAGEVACTGLHGANRLASTSLLEALVFGRRAAESAVAELMALKHQAQQAETSFSAKPWVGSRNPVDLALIHQDQDLLKQTLWNYVGLIRSEHRLKRAERMLTELRNEVEWFYQRSVLTEELLELRQGVLVATLLLYAALRRPESVGTHFLAEF